MGRQGLDLSGHRSRPLDPDLVNEADVIYTMTSSHLEAVLAMAPQAAGKTFLLDGEVDIDDPFGSDEAQYAAVAEQVRSALGRRLME